MGHHEVRVEKPPDVWTVARPARAGWWTQRRRQRRCGRELGHCWHPGGFVDWWCCSCSADTDGPSIQQRCTICAANPALRAL